MKSTIIAIFLIIGLAGCTYYQSATVKDDKIYIVTNEGFGGMIWGNGIQECQKNGSQMTCVEIKKE